MPGGPHRSPHHRNSAWLPVLADGLCYSGEKGPMSTAAILITGVRANSSSKALVSSSACTGWLGEGGPVMRRLAQKNLHAD